jgi:hypothetical protein
MFGFYYVVGKYGTLLFLDWPTRKKNKQKPVMFTMWRERDVFYYLIPSSFYFYQ